MLPVSVLVARIALLPNLGKWLLFVAALRSMSALLGFVKPSSIQSNLYSLSNVSLLTGRIFGTWTSISCILSVLLAFDLGNEGLFYATFSTFALALVHFAGEVFVFRTMKFRNAMSPFFIATFTMYWMYTDRLA